MSKLIVSGEKPYITKKLKESGFEIIESETIDALPEFEKNHADIQCLRIKNTCFVLKDYPRLKNELLKTEHDVIETERRVGSKYPDNVLLNAVFFNNRLYGKLSAVDLSVRDFCLRNEIEMINVNQGYTKCSVAILGDRFITADKGIFKSMSGRGERGLLIDAGNIELSGVDYGFIGGCCFEKNNTVYFTGNIGKHPDYKRILEFLSDKEIVCLSDETLYDIGGFVAV